MPKPEEFQARIDRINALAAALKKPSVPVIVCYTPNGPCMGEHIRRLYSQRPDDAVGQRIDLQA